jgi:hypothetical protein
MTRALSKAQAIRERLGGHRVEGESEEHLMPQICTIARHDEIAAAHRATLEIQRGPLKRRPITCSRRAQATAPARPANAPLPSLMRRCVFKQATFLDAYRGTASLSAAAKAAGISPTQHYQRLERDPRYWRAFGEAQMEVVDALQDEAVERAFEGWAEPVLYRGPSNRNDPALFRSLARVAAQKRGSRNSTR